MDIISLNEAATANGRIERFTTNPDSNSGVLTQPKVIEAGETVTIKSGRQAILTDTVVDGDLVIEAGGDVLMLASVVPTNSLEDIIDTLDSSIVKLTGEQTINGVKTFASSPKVPSPIYDNDAVNKQYVDAYAGGGSGLSIEDKTKLDGIEEKATKNETDAFLLSRSNHTGTIPISVVENLEQELANISTSGTNTGDETLASIKSKLGISTLSGSNTGDQTITLTGDVTGSGTGSFATTLANSGVTVGTYKSVTVDSKGRVTSGTNPTTVSGYGITDTYTKTEIDTVLGNINSALDTINGQVI